MTFDYVVVGAGLTGATIAERIASVLDKRVLVVERRRWVAGHAHDAYNAGGVLVHTYGPHIFHTKNPKVFQYLSSFTEWRPYEHRVLAAVDGREVPVPFNLTSMRLLFPQRIADLLEEKLVQRYGAGAKVTILQLREEAEPELQLLADFIYEKIFLGYKLKQWGLRPEQLDPSVTGRVPVVVSYDDRYFCDPFQAMPKEGFTAMVQRMLDHKNITLLLGTSWQEIQEDFSSSILIYTGPIDEFFAYRFGVLPYRSLRFHYENLALAQYQRVGQVNFPLLNDYTRIVEFKHLTGQHYLPHTTISFEFPEDFVPGKNDPYYPVPTAESTNLYARYLEAAKQCEHVYFAGRLGDYRYYNMDQAVARALELFTQLARGCA